MSTGAEPTMQTNAAALPAGNAIVDVLASLDATDCTLQSFGLRTTCQKRWPA